VDCSNTRCCHTLQSLIDCPSCVLPLTCASAYGPRPRASLHAHGQSGCRPARVIAGSIKGAAGVDGKGARSRVLASVRARTHTRTRTHTHTFSSVCPLAEDRSRIFASICIMVNDACSSSRRPCLASCIRSDSPSALCASFSRLRLTRHCQGSLPAHVCTVTHREQERDVETCARAQMPEFGRVGVAIQLPPATS
jgi:hypothetical protein